MPVPDELPERSPTALGFLVSGEGTILEGIQDRIATGHLEARISAVIADRPGTGALARASRLGLDTVELPRARGGGPEWARRLDEALRGHRVDLVVLDGFLSVVPAEVVERWTGRMINVHPSLLPRFGGPGFYGARVHEAVLRSGDAETGVTVHDVTTAVDAGPIRVQRRMRVEPGESAERLRDRLRPLEIDALVEAIRSWTPPGTGTPG